MAVIYGPRTFNPLSLSPALWLDASDSSTLYNATTGGSLVAADGAVARWEDKSGNARHATQSSIGSRPLRKTSVQNSRDVIRFDGSNDFLVPALSVGVMRNVLGGSIFAVCKLTNGAKSDQTVINFSRNGNISQLRLGLQLASGGGEQLFRAGARRLDSDGFTGATANNNLNFNVLGAVGDYSGGTISLRVNALSIFSNLPSSGATSDTDSAVVEIGKAAGTYLSGEIAEILVFPAVLSTLDRQSLERYLANKWGITLA